MWFAARAAIVGSPVSEFESAVPFFQEELERRSHLRNPRVFWDSRHERVVVEIEDEHESAEGVQLALNDDLCDSVAAVVGEWDDFDIRFLDVQAM